MKLRTQTRKLQLIDFMVLRAKAGSSRSMRLLLQMFDPMIHKIANRIHHRTHGRIGIDELYESGKIEFMRLVLMEYIPKGLPGHRAQFNWYMNMYVHAELWKLYEPLTRHIPMEADDLEAVGTHTLPEYSSNTNIESIVAYSMINLNQQEKHVITHCVMNGTTYAQEAMDLGVTTERISQIKTAAIKKLQVQMKAHNLSAQDITWK